MKNNFHFFQNNYRSTGEEKCATKNRLARQLAFTLGSSVLLTGCQTSALRAASAEDANLEKAILCMEIIEVDLDVDAFGEKCIAENYIQHSQHVPDGRDGVLKYFGERIAKFPNTHGDVKRASAQGDLVWLHMHVKSKPETRGNAVIHIFRMENGKFAEHWAVGRPVPEKSVHGNSMF